MKKKLRMRCRILGLLILISTMGFIISCQKFVDIKKTSQQNNIESTNDCQLLLDNYANMNTDYPSDAEASSDNYYLSGQSYLGLNLEDQGVHTWLKTSIRQGASPQWQSPYKVVFFANLVLEALDNIKIKNLEPQTPQNVIDGLRGAALFFRAYAFWNIAQIYAQPYNSATASNDLGIPLKLTSDINEVSVRSSVKDTYDKIIADLTEASNLMQPTSQVPTRPSKVAALAMLARVYLSIEDYSNALIKATSALQIKSDLLDYNTISKTATNPFTRFNKEVIFHSIIVTNDLLKPGSQNNPTARIDKELVALYDTNDLRRYIFLKPNNSPFRDPVSGTVSNLPDGSYRFSGNYEPANSGNANQFNGLAVDELYLISAECNARINKISDSMSDLNVLLKNRWISGTYTNINISNSDQALSIVLSERRKELLMRSQRWTDLKRLNKDIKFKKDLVRNIVFIPSTDPFVATPSPISFNLPANDLRYTLQIPQEVITNSSIKQNLR